MNITVAETGYIGLSLPTLLAQNNKVTVIDFISELVGVKS